MAVSPELPQNLTYGARLLANSPPFTAVAVLSLALGTRAHTAIFSLINAVLLKTLPVAPPRQLVSLADPTSSGTSIGAATGARRIFSTPQFEALRARTQPFSGLLASQSESAGLRLSTRAPRLPRRSLIALRYE